MINNSAIDGFGQLKKPGSLVRTGGGVDSVVLNLLWCVAAIVDDAIFQPSSACRCEGWRNSCLLFVGGSPAERLPINFFNRSGK